MVLRRQRFDKAETLLLLRSYQVHPADFKAILTEMRQNTSQLTSAVGQMYMSTSNASLVQRLRDKFYKLNSMRQPHEDDEIRSELESIKHNETRHVTDTRQERNEGGGTVAAPEQKTSGEDSTSTGDGNEDDDEESSENNDAPADIRDRWATGEKEKRVRKREGKRAPKRQRTEKRRKGKKSTRELIRDNEEKKNKLLSYLLSKRKRLVGASSSSSSSTETESSSESDSD